MSVATDDRSDILIVDDLPDKLLAFGALLEDLGQNLVYAHSGAEALRQVLQREFAVILLDVNMPDIDGFETATLIRGHRRSAHTPIIFITAYADEMQAARGYALGAVDYILSPVVSEVLRSKVKVFVELHRMQRQLRRQGDEQAALAAAQAARHAAEESERRASFKAEASRQLGAALDVDVATERLVELLVPQWTSLALLLLAEGDGRLDKASLAVVDEAHPSRARAVRARAAQLDPVARQRLDEALRLRSRTSLHDLDLSSLAAALHLPPDALAPRQMIATPLLSPDRTLGLLVVATNAERRAQAAGDVTMLDELAGRTVMALTNIALYRDLQTEIAERRVIEAELQETNRRKDEFLAMLSHELRNPLAPIRGAVEIIRRVAPPHPKLEWATDVTDRQVRHLSRLVDDLLDVARISHGKFDLKRERVDLRHIVQTSAEAAESGLIERRQSLHLDLPATPVWVQGDSARLAQVVANLLHNAGKFSDEAGRVELTLQADAGQARLAVRDHGSGIEPHVIPHIFDLFSQGDRTLDRSKGGLGVGLTLVRRIVQLHGGEVSAHSAGSGQGAEFEVVVPCIASVGGARDDVAPAIARAPEPQGRRVMVIDDNRDAAESLAVFLQLAGHEVKALTDPLQALASLPVFAPEVMVVDIGLPQMDGYELARRVRAAPPPDLALLVAVSGYGQPEHKRRSQEAGFDYHITKPADLNELAALIAEAPRAGSVAAGTPAQGAANGR